jgi:hypothetical protein
MASDSCSPGRHFVVIGAQRSGTTYLRTLLGEHPDIAMTEPASPEPKVFLSDAVTEQGHDWYDTTYFTRGSDAARLGEKSTSYLEVPASIDRIRRVLGPGTQVIVQLRDPVARAVSNWQLSSHHGLETRTLEQALEDNLHGPREWDPGRTSVSPFAYLERGCYADQLAPWRDAFGDQLRVLILEELLADPGTGPSSMTATYSWLGVRPEFRPPSLGRQVNRSRVEAPLLGSELTARLRGYFSGSDGELETYLGRPLPWSESGSPTQEPM